MKSLQLSTYEYEIQVFDDAFAILKNNAAGALANSQIGKSILEKGLAFIKEVIATEKEILIAFNDAKPIALEELKRIEIAVNVNPKTWNIPFCIRYEEDWKRISQHTGLNRQEYIETFLKSEYTMHMNGFLPGFPYLGGLPDVLHCPRKSNPAIKVEAGSVAIGGPYVGIYPVDTPGGWNVIGQTPIELLDSTTMPPTYLHPGDVIEFKLIDNAEFSSIKSKGLTLNEYNQD